jgi:hypothetical protein
MIENSIGYVACYRYLLYYYFVIIIIIIIIIFILLLLLLIFNIIDHYYEIVPGEDRKINSTHKLQLAIMLLLT